MSRSEPVARPRTLPAESGLVMLMVVLLLSACASLQPSFETPSVDVVSVRPLTSSEIAPRFEITLRVVNPNSSELKLRGMSYKLALDDLDVVEGVASDLPVVPAYGEGDVRLEATVSLIDSLRFVSGVLREGRAEDITWRLQAKLDIGALIPPIRIEERGALSMNR
jgi:LEA14-like dessication related protein